MKLSLIDKIKILVYNSLEKQFLDKIDFDNDEIFREPLLFTYFNSKNIDISLVEIIQGYFNTLNSLELTSFNDDGVAYVPNIGYFNKQKEKIENIFFLNDSNIEVLIYRVEILNNIFFDLDGKLLDKNQYIISKDLTTKFIPYLENTFSFIKTFIPSFYKSIEKFCRKMVIFATDPKNTNSFATINSHGIFFINVYQEEYDEVFFVDDIAHQAGHIILTSLISNDKDLFFKIDASLKINLLFDNTDEYRTIEVLFHALYTYYTSMVCLDNCIDNECFSNIQNHEAKGRIGFYILKSRRDIEKFRLIIDHFGGENFILGKKGLILYKEILYELSRIDKKWSTYTSSFLYSNQPYNFTFKNFISLNPLKDE